MSTTLIILTILAVALIAVLITYLICQRRETTLQNRIVELQGVVQSRDEDRVEKEAMYSELKARALGMENENRDLRALKESQGKELELLHRQMEQERAERTKQLQDQLALVKEQLTTTTQEMLRQRTADLHQANAQQMGAIINPLKETIREMKSSVERLMRITPTSPL